MLIHPEISLPPLENEQPGMPSQFNNVILAANPSHQQPSESTFWKNFGRQVHARGWHFVQLAMRKIPDLPNAHTICIPARLWQLGALSKKIDVRKRFPLPWVDFEFLALMEDWEHRRWELKERNPEVLDNLRGLVHWIDFAMASLRPAAVLTCNKIDHAPSLFNRAGRYYGAFTALIERSPFDDIWFEPEGLFGESHIWREYPEFVNSREDLLHRRVGVRIVRKLNKNPYGFRAGEAGVAGETLGKLFGRPRPVFFMPMDNALWTGWEQPEHPQLPIDYYHASPDAALAQVQDIVTRLGGTLIVKNHPSCVYINKDKMPEGTIFHDGDLQELITLCDVLVAFNTKTAFPALAMGKPVVTLAPNPVAAGGCTYHSNSIEGVAAALESAMRRENLEEKLERFIPFAGWLATRYFYRWDNNPVHPQRTPRDLANQIIDGCIAARETSVENVTTVMARLNELSGKKQPPPDFTPDPSLLERLDALASRPGFAGEFTPIVKNWRTCDTQSTIVSDFQPREINAPGIEEAHWALASGDSQSAARLAFAVLKERPNDIDAMLLAAQTLIEENKLKTAEAALRQALAIAPENPLVLRRLIDFHIHINAPELALPRMVRLIQLDPDLARAGRYDDFETLAALIKMGKLENRGRDEEIILNVLHFLSADNPGRLHRYQELLTAYFYGLEVMNLRLRQRAVTLANENKQIKAQADASAKLPQTVESLKKQIATLKQQLAVKPKEKLVKISPAQFFKTELNTLDARLFWKLRSAVYGSEFWPTVNHLIEKTASLLLGKRLAGKLTTRVFGEARVLRLREKYAALVKASKAS